MTPATATAPVTVYVMRDASGAALYVGCTSRGIVRPTEHRCMPWYRDVVSVDFEHYDDRPAGFARERQLIEELQPEHTGISGRRDRSTPVRKVGRSIPPRRSSATMLDDYLAGATLREVGAAHGVSGERVRQLLVRDASWLFAWEKQRRLARTRLRAAAADHRRMVEYLRPCRVCRDMYCKAGQSATCSGECQDLLLAIGQHLPDRGRMGRLKGKGRWLIPGSSAWDAARVCYERQYPIFDELPVDIQRQARGELRSWDRLPRPCERCGEATTNSRFCTLECYRATGRIGQPAEVSA